MPTAEANQWVEVTAPNVPMISGRVVNLGPAAAPKRGEALTKRLLR